MQEKAVIIKLLCNKTSTFSVLYTGNVTLRGEGCVEALYGCPKHGGPADGHINTTHGRYFLDNYKPAQHDEKICMLRALQLWRYCGSSHNYPVTTIYLQTGICHLYNMYTLCYNIHLYFRLM